MIVKSNCVVSLTDVTDFSWNRRLTSILHHSLEYLLKKEDIGNMSDPRSNEMLKFPLVVDITSSLFRVANKEKEAVRLAVSLLQQGHVVALPTDTVYGIACDAQNHEALKSLYRIKARDTNKPIAICVGSVKDVGRWGVTESVPTSLLEDLLPGPVTVLLGRTKKLNPTLNSFTDKVGIRVPNCPFVLNIANELGRPLALTSANISKEPSPISAEECFPIWQHLAAVFDGGRLGSQQLDRSGSTIVDLSVEGCFKITREGSALSETIAKLLKHGLMPFESVRTACNSTKFIEPCNP